MPRKGTGNVWARLTEKQHFNFKIWAMMIGKTMEGLATEIIVAALLKDGLVAIRSSLVGSKQLKAWREEVREKKNTGDSRTGESDR